jgi:hypothetical protein
MKYYSEMFDFLVDLKAKRFGEEQKRLGDWK